jgi:hypothetical protein
VAKTIVGKSTQRTITEIELFLTKRNAFKKPLTNREAIFGEDQLLSHQIFNG